MLSRIRARLRREAPLGLVLAVLVGWLGPAVGGGRVLVYRDLHHQYIGTARLLAGEAGAGGHLLWDPLLNGGQPLLGNPNRAVLYPTRLVYRLTDAVTGMQLEILFHLLLGAAGAYLLARRIRLGPWAAAVAGAAWSLGGLSASLTSHLLRCFAFHWIPWLVAAADWAARGPGRRRWPVVSLVLAVQLLSGGLEMVGAGWLTAAVWVVTAGPEGRRVQALGRLLPASVLGASMAAVQVVPAAAMVARSGRAVLGAAARLTWSVHPLRLPELMVPGWMGPVDVAGLAGRYWGEHLVDRGVGYFPSLYLGASVLALAVVGLRAARGRRLARALGVLGTVGAALSLGRYLPGMHSLVAAAGNLVPLRFPVKALVLAALPAVILSAMGAEGVARRRGVALWISGAACLAAVPWMGALLAPGAASRLLGILFGEPGGVVASGPARALAHTSLALAGLAAVAAVGRVRAAAPLLLLVVTVDLLPAAAAAVPRGPRWLLERRPPAVRLVETLVDHGRFYRAPDPIPLPMRVAADRAWATTEVDLSRLDGYLAASYGVPMIYHADDPMLAGRRIAALAEHVWKAPLERAEPLLRLGGVRWVLAPSLPEVPWLGPALRIASPSPVPLLLASLRPAPKMAWFVEHAIHASEGKESLQRVVSPGFDPRVEVIVEPTPPVLGWSGPAEEVGSWSVHAPAAGWAVLSVPWLPGIEVWEESERLPVHPADGAFVAVEVPPGDHRLAVRYRPPEVARGLAITVLSLLVLAAWATWPGGSRPR